MTWPRNRGKPKLWLELGEEGPWGGKWENQREAKSPRPRRGWDFSGNENP